MIDKPYKAGETVFVVMTRWMGGGGSITNISVGIVKERLFLRASQDYSYVVITLKTFSGMHKNRWFVNRMYIEDVPFTSKGIQEINKLVCGTKFEAVWRELSGEDLKERVVFT